MERLTHLRPPEQNSELPSFHTIDINVEGKTVGSAILEYHSKPMPLYYVGDITINEEERGKHYGSEIMEYIENMLREKGKAGILSDGIAERNRNSPAIGMYARRGWQEVPGTSLFVYNIPSSTVPGDFRDFKERKNRPGRIERLDRRYSEKTPKESGSSVPT